MDLRAQAEHLRDALRAAQRVIERPYQDAFLLPHESRLGLAVSGGLVSPSRPIAVATVAADGELPTEPLVIPRRMLAEYLATLQGECRLRLEGQRVILACGRSQAAFATAVAEPLPLGIGETSAEVVVPAERSGCIADVSFAAARDDVRPALQYVWLIGNMAIGVDGYRLAAAPLGVETPCPIPVLPRPASQARGNDLRACLGEHGIRYEVGQLLVVDHAPAVSPPPVQDVMERARQAATLARATVPTKRLVKAMRAAARANYDGLAYLYIAPGLVRLVAVTSWPEGEDDALQADVDTETEGSGWAAFTPAYLADALSTGEAATIALGQPAEAAVIEAGGVMHVVMPRAVSHMVRPPAPANADAPGRDHARLENRVAGAGADRQQGGAE